MCWDMIIKHCNDACLTNAEYFSQLGADLRFDPLLKEYVQQAHALCCCSPAPTGMPIAPEFQPYFHGPCINSPNHSRCRKDSPCMSTLQPSQLPPAFSTCKIGQCHSDAPLNLWTPAMSCCTVSTTPNLHKLQVCYPTSTRPSMDLIAATSCGQSRNMAIHFTLFLLVTHLLTA
jgi:hypothetical protein